MLLYLIEPMWRELFPGGAGYEKDSACVTAYPSLTFQIRVQRGVEAPRKDSLHTRPSGSYR
jgi:hypothetical protein